MLSINSSEIPSGRDYQWVTVAVCGDRSLGQVSEFEKNGWRAVPASRHPALAKKSTSGTEIEYGGLLLMERPQHLTSRAVAWENEKARAQRKVGHHVHVERTFTLRERGTRVAWAAFVGLRRKLRRIIVSAAPTCTLWRYSINKDGWAFTLCPAWTISRREYVELTGATS